MKSNKIQTKNIGWDLLYISFSRRKSSQNPFPISLQRLYDLYFSISWFKGVYYVGFFPFIKALCGCLHVHILSSFSSVSSFGVADDYIRLSFFSFASSRLMNRFFLLLSLASATIRSLFFYLLVGF